MPIVSTQLHRTICIYSRYTKLRYGTLNVLSKMFNIYYLETSITIKYQPDGSGFINKFLIQDYDVRVAIFIQIYSLSNNCKANGSAIELRTWKFKS